MPPSTTSSPQEEPPAPAGCSAAVPGGRNEGQGWAEPTEEARRGTDWWTSEHYWRQPEGGEAMLALFLISLWGCVKNTSRFETLLPPVHRVILQSILLQHSASNYLDQPIHIWRRYPPPVTFDIIVCPHSRLTQSSTPITLSTSQTHLTLLSLKVSHTQTVCPHRPSQIRLRRTRICKSNWKK